VADIANRYVTALLDSAKSKEDNKMFEKGLKEISNLFTSDKNFKNVLLNPRIASQEKLDIIKEIFPEYTKSEVFVNFLKLLIEAKRIDMLVNISDEYSKITSSLNKELNMKIVTAMKIDDEQINEITKKYKELYKADTVKYEVEIDESILGGIKVIIGNKIYDSSIKTQLNQMF
jgi:F-type H+-transporting ATPase subunit delta